MTELLVPARFNGPPGSGNGGWTAGGLVDLLNAPLGSTARVTLRQPPPLDVALSVTDGVAVDAAGAVVAAAELLDDDLAPVEAVSLAVATEAAASYSGLTSHPFPTCFACGTERAEGDGLRIFPGRVADDTEGRVRIAAPWTPHASHGSLAVAWAALDCVGGWAGDLEERLMVLGRMTARVDAMPALGEPHVVVGGARGRDGRKTFTASTLYDAEGRVVGVAAHVWIAVDPAAFSA